MSEPIRRALLSVWDKSGLVDFARGLTELGVTLMATGGTAELLRREGLHPEETRDLTGFASLLGGRVKTLHPRVHAGILARRNREEDMTELRREEIAPIDMVVVNFYPFPGADDLPDMDFESVTELIDIGGPAMLRGTAKNCAYVVPVSRPDQYSEILSEMKNHGGEIGWETRLRLARDAFASASAYDGRIARYFASMSDDGTATEGALPDALWISSPRLRELAYGENPHQGASFYQWGESVSGLAAMEVLGGKTLSYNNLLDLDALVRLLGEFSEPTAAILKHTTPCGVGRGENAAQALSRAMATDPMSAFGGVFGVNCPLTREAVEILGDHFMEVFLFPEAEAEALELLGRRKKLRIIRLASGGASGAFDLRAVAGGLLVQTRDPIGIGRTTWSVAGKREPSEDEWSALEFAWRVVKHVKSNAIVLADGGGTIGIGAGQMSRVDSVRLASRKAEEAGLDTKGTVLASDGFFPFADGVEAAAEAGVTAVVEPGGSIRDREVVEAADRLGLAIVFTGRRGFRH